MTVLNSLAAGNAGFADDRFTSGLRMMPSLRTIVIGCVDPRVDPVELLGAAPGELAVLRNVGGRVTPEAVRELQILRAVTQAAGGDLGAGWTLLVLQHTDCGITRVHDAPELLAGYFGTDDAGVSTIPIDDPAAAVRHDVEVLRSMTGLGEGVHVSGAVYDVGTGRVSAVVD